MMKKVLYLASFLLLLTACNETEQPTTESEGNGVNSAEFDEIKKENLILKRELAAKDSTIDYFASYMNEVRTNLDLIRDKQGLIISYQANPEMLTADNPDLIEDIKVLAQLMADNKSKISQLKSEISNANLQMSEFEEMIISLTEEVEMKNMEIYQLQQELENMDGAFTELFQAYEETSEQLDIAKDHINTAWFTYGTKDELYENGVITKEGGFIGIGKINKLKDDFNKTYFTEVKIDALTEIPLGVKKADIITTHPQDSYDLVDNGETIEKLAIKDQAKFWGASKYLVIVVK